MTNDSIQVQNTPGEQALQDELLAWVKERETNPRARLKCLEWPRQYPGEEEAALVTGYLELGSQPPKAQEAALEVLRSLQRFEQAGIERKGVVPRRLAPGLRALYRKIEKSLRSVNFLIWVKDGHLQLGPGSVYGMFIQDVLTLFEKSRLNRIRQCQHCGTWFYARFNHQQFCNDAGKRCQWTHYHSPEWRKLNRERNRKHQSEYRKRNPGRRH